jgi:hypothetical protein
MKFFTLICALCAILLSTSACAPFSGISSVSGSSVCSIYSSEAGKLSEDAEFVLIEKIKKEIKNETR